MKKIVYLFFAATFFAVSCSSSDDTAAVVPSSGDTNFLPLSAGNYWVYNISGNSETGRDSLFVANDTVIGANTYKSFKTRNEPLGFFSSALSNNGVKKDGDKIVVTGSTSLSISEEVPFTIGVSDFVLFKESAQNNEVLATVSGALNQEYNGLPITIDYTLKTTATGSLPSITVNNQIYTNVKTVKTEIFAKLTTVFAGFPVVLLENQNIVTSTQFYAENVGCVKTVTDFGYVIQAEIAAQLNIPASSQQHQEELLSTYSAE